MGILATPGKDFLWKIDCDECDTEAKFNEIIEESKAAGWSITLYGSIPVVKCPKHKTEE